MGPRPVETYRLSTSTTELSHLLIAYLVLSFDFALIRANLLTGQSPLTRLDVIAQGLPFGAVAALTAFVAHEMAHKFSAQQHGFWAEFRMSPSGLFLSVVVALFGFLIAAPGATVVGGMGDVREWGRTSLAGPVVNVAQGSLFLAGAAVAAGVGSDGWATTLLLLALLNGWFGAFNLIR
ncbi:MAG: metalloprotease, partial [Thermoplasmata archaeon]|nr:metalloprotease [Thermoplasmata archaeon]